MNLCLGVSCTSPVGSFAQIQHSTLQLLGAVLSRDGQTQLHTHQSGSMTQAEAIGQKAAQDLLTQGAKQIL